MAPLMRHLYITARCRFDDTERMPQSYNRCWFARLFLGCALVSALGCEGLFAPKDTTARVFVSLQVPAVVRTVEITITGPGLDSAVTVTQGVSGGTTRTDTLTVRAGSDRRVVVTGRDAAGVATHRGETTVTLRAGTNPPVTLGVDPLQGSLVLVVEFRQARVVVGDTTPRRLAGGDTATVSALAVAPDGSMVPASDVRWGSTNPAVVRAEPGRAIGVRTGTATLVVSYAGQAVRVPITVTED